MSSDWDIDSYKTGYENEEHWELRKSFMLAHKDKLSEDELVSLSQVFTNIEILGCRYPEKTMIRVAELAKGVVENFREKRKNSLKRTFVSASSAASAKVKGNTPKSEEIEIQERKRIKITNIELGSKIRKIEEQGTSCAEFSVENHTKSNGAIQRSKYGGVKSFKIEPNKPIDVQPVIKPENKKASGSEVQCESDSLVKPEKLKKFVVVLPDEEEHPIILMQMNASLNKCALRWKVEGALKTCKLYLNEECVGIGTGKSGKEWKVNAAKNALARLRESHYGIKIKACSSEVVQVNPSQLEKGSETTPETLGENNVGRKLMKLMGWQGGGLGSKEQGMERPVTATLHVRREGLGLKRSSCNIKKFRNHARQYIQAWAKSSTEEKLAFSMDFTREERKIMHKIARSFSLISKSYGKEDNRYLVITRRLDPVKILDDLLESGNSDKYELLTPTKC